MKISDMIRQELEKAVREKIPLLLADLTAFETAGRLYALLEADRCLRCYRVFLVETER